MSFGFKSLGHFFASAYHDLIIGEKAIEHAAPTVNTVENVAETLTPLVLTGPMGTAAVVLERAIFAIAGHVFGAVHAADAAAAEKGVNIQLDADLVNEIKDIIALTPKISATASALFPTKPPAVSPTSPTTEVSVTKTPTV